MSSFIKAKNAVSKELYEVEMILKNIGKDFSSGSTQEIFEYFFKVPGKYLRPSLIILSAKAINPEMTIDERMQLINLCVAIELIHSASLVHDDIIDNDLFRRGQKTLNNIYGRKVAVLAGDAFYAKAFSILLKLPTNDAEEIITQVIEKMCIAEIEQAQNHEIAKQDYFNIIEGKTASFMAACCKLGAKTVKAKEEEITALENYGLNLGMVYQIIDDYTDGDSNASKNNITAENAKEFALKAEQAIKNLEPSVYKDNLNSLLNYVLESSNKKTKNA
ncbi:polyprenyl synthetase family protein [Clostridium beijerinckii]|uniref:Polyprenyl synthetase n=1 Tax=Clostridium beijerinckii TaxID=1520 RepID=A0A1S9N4R7_CLOBE|nr:polyprenyl synthetase family protein [Clostridium beijerinckii]MZK51160.1 polyprenyl synthetase family protein [Clostridium beijerinckii]MZK59362.1 polyprenyl synthetase family protein [Clostridium beijerinckii]MZK69481.1 polyprenyl synthetase family protein [Clostridium beijerinckii]MZK74855.1 polyprenyl synthetase family protein [Clostridium beijerinckii]MZK84572.1 polyprenyl synthetase family protein [Clostridium beijerinckii]